MDDAISFALALGPIICSTPLAWLVFWQKKKKCDVNSPRDVFQDIGLTVVKESKRDKLCIIWMIQLMNSNALAEIK